MSAALVIALLVIALLVGVLAGLGMRDVWPLLLRVRKVQVSFEGDRRDPP